MSNGYGGGLVGAGQAVSPGQPRTPTSMAAAIEGLEKARNRLASLLDQVTRLTDSVNGSIPRPTAPSDGAINPEVPPLRHRLDLVDTAIHRLISQIEDNLGQLEVSLTG